MNTSFCINLGIFWLLQILVQTALKLGSQGGASMRSRRWWIGFVASNTIGIISILFLKELYKAMPDSPNIVPAISMAGSFILTQLVFLVAFRARPTAIQWTGIALLAIGGFLASLGA